MPDYSSDLEKCSQVSTLLTLNFRSKRSKSFPKDAGGNVLASPLHVALQNQMQIIVIYSIFTAFMKASGGIFNFT